MELAGEHRRDRLGRACARRVRGEGREREANDGAGEVDDRAAVTKLTRCLLVDDKGAADIGPLERIERAEVVVGHGTENHWARGGVHDDVDTPERLGRLGEQPLNVEFVGRARRELRATGEKPRKRRDDTRDELTPQEEQIARLARDGRTNPEIGAELFISPRTVEWHLRKVFTKLGISSRNGLHDALPSRDRNRAPA